MTAQSVPAMAASPSQAGRLLLIGLISFLTLVDLLAVQAILPSLAVVYHASPAEMGVAVNASTFGMAAAGLVIAALASRLDRKRGIWMSLAALTIPTLLLSTMPDLGVITALRVVQGILMSSAFTLTMAYLAEEKGSGSVAAALAAYVTGNVASNLFGRLMSAAVADHFGLSFNFVVFAALNLTGAIIVYIRLDGMRMGAMKTTVAMTFASWRSQFGNPALTATFAIGFLILFAFLGTFTYVNFVLAGPIGLSPMAPGLVYFVFAPSILTTPLVARAVARFGIRATFIAAFAVALAGTVLLLVAALTPVLAGLCLIAAGTFFAQAAATGHVGRLAAGDRAAASGIYLASYCLGGLAGSLALGMVYAHWGWREAVLGIAISLSAAGALSLAVQRQTATAA